MTDQQNDLKEILDQQKKLIEEMQKMQADMMAKQESYLRLQGVSEYLMKNGVTVPTE